jgi:hypothetical protein
LSDLSKINGPAESTRQNSLLIFDQLVSGNDEEMAFRVKIEHGEVSRYRIAGTELNKLSISGRRYFYRLCDYGLCPLQQPLKGHKPLLLGSHDWLFSSGHAGCGLKRLLLLPARLGFTDLKSAQLGQFLDISVNDNFGASAAIVVPTPAVPYLEAYLALLHAVPGIGLTVVRFSGGPPSRERRQAP